MNILSQDVMEMLKKIDAESARNRIHSPRTIGEFEIINVRAIEQIRRVVVSKVIFIYLISKYRDIRRFKLHQQSVSIRLLLQTRNGGHLKSDV